MARYYTEWTTLGQALKQARLSRGLRQNQVPGIAQSTLANWESGRRWPKWSDILRLSEIYRVDPTSFTPFFTPDAGQFVGVRHLEEAARMGDWATVWQEGYRFLRRHRQKVPLAAYSRVEQLLAQAISAQPWLGLIRQQQTLENELQVAAAMHNLGLGSQTLLHWFERLADQYDAQHPSYLKVLNNGALYAEKTGNLPCALEWVDRAISWAKAHQQWDRVPELEAMAFRLQSYQQGIAGHDMYAAVPVNTFVHEDVCIGFAWRCWNDNNVREWEELKKWAVRTWMDESPMPPWLTLWEAAWAWRHKQEPQPLQDWVGWWLQDGRNLWQAHWDWYLRDAMLLAGKSEHPAFAVWQHWWAHYLHRHQEEGWLTVL
ncbi:MAG: hypothetical protein C7B47_15910 [Sulfobacillus thermosulfidooxidans]|uniref:HTH cro/C1-type domain-containing protein n=1 Tax=Sulfobacillus thermosulfidooxidans TaxID=28034 RepID=A0A2T2WMF6_SULTH|nr:MAG: hypothetical protein C7B47_15910 [Sulfobacillus thermosulfidooxidans]